MRPLDHGLGTLDAACGCCYKWRMSHATGFDLAPGSTVAGYEVKTLIGRGGMGAVYRAREEGSSARSRSR